MRPDQWTAVLLGLLAACGTTGGIGSWIATRRATKKGISDKQTEARETERRERHEADQRVQQRTDKELERLGTALANAQTEIDELREGQRQQFVRDERQRAVLLHHAAWDWLVVQELRKHGIPAEDPPALTVNPNGPDAPA